MQGMNSSTSLPDAHSGRLVALFAGAKLLLHLANLMVIFFIISFPLTRLAAYLERRLA